jgi:hypothetical protein
MPNFLSDWFGFIYDRVFNIYNVNFQTPVFQYFFDSGFYVKLGLIFIFIPLVLMAIFYFFWKYPYGKWLHWLIWYVVTILVVLGGTFGYANQFINASNAQEMITCYNVHECAEYIKGLPMEYAKTNAFLGLIVGFIGSLILKQFSKVQTHLPF